MADVDAGIDSGVGADSKETVVDSAPSDGSEQDNTNWEELYKAEHDRAENYKEAFSKKREFVKKGETDPVVEETEDNKPITRSELSKAIVETITPIVAGSKVDQELEKQVKDPEKRKLVKLLYETRVRQMGTSDDAIRNDISAALAIADAHKLRNATAEITRKQNMQQTPPLNGSSSEPAPQTKNHKFSEQQVAALTQRAKNLGMEPQKFLEQAWRNQTRG